MACQLEVLQHLPITRIETLDYTICCIQNKINQGKPNICCALNGTVTYFQNTTFRILKLIYFKYT